MPDKSIKQIIVEALRDNAKLLFFTAGIVAVVLAAAKGVAYKGILPIPDMTGRIGLAAFGFLLIFIGFFENRLGGDGVTPNPKDFDIEIVSPQPGEAVTRLDVRGKISKKLPRGYTLWIFRMYRDDSLWPVRKCVVYDDTGEWEAMDCDIGVSAEKKAFAVNLVGSNGAALIDYVYAAMGTHNSLRDKLAAQTGQTDLPQSPTIRTRTSDMIECKRVKVQRPHN